MSAARLLLPLLCCAVIASAAPVLAGGPLTSGVTAAGSVAGPSFSDAWTFDGTSGDRIVVAVVTTSGTMNTQSTLHPPSGPAQVVTVADRWEFQLLQTGTYTLEISDLNLDEPGTYAITYLNLTSGPLTHAGDLDGGAIASGEVFAGTLDGITDLDAFTITGNAGDRVLFGALEGAAPPFNVTLAIYPPGGGAPVSGTSGGNRLDYQLAASGTYTVVVEDIANDHTGGYTVSHLNVTSGPHSTLADPDGATIPSATLATGTMNGVVDWDAFTITGNAGDRIVVVALTTSGTMNTSSVLYAPNGTLQISTGADRWEYQLGQSGTHTIVMEDQGFGDTGTYLVYVLNLTSGPLTAAGDLDGGPIGSGEVLAGTMDIVPDIDAFTFTGTAGDHVLFGVLEGTITPFNITLALYPPGGGAVVASTSGGNKIDYQLAASGTYTVVVEDIANDHTGSYTVSHLNVTSGPHTTAGDPDGSPIASAAGATGTMNGVVDWDAFTLSGTAGDRIVVVALTTSGTMNTTCSLYPPNGGSAQVATSADRWDFQLTQTGTHTLVIEDQNFGETGTYTLSLLNLTSGPLTTLADPDGGPIASDEVRTGALAIADLDAYSFSGAAGDRIAFAGIATSPLPFNTLLTLYGPAGGPVVANSSGNDRIDFQLASSGTYVLVIDDISDNDPGDYAVSFVNVTSGPVTGTDPDGGWLVSGDTRTGDVSPAPDMDVYWFNAEPGDTAKVNCVTLSGPLNTYTYLYPPGGAAPVVATLADNWTYAIQASGKHALLVQHSDLTQTGGYQLGLTGPLTVDVPVEQPTPGRLALSAPRPNPSSGPVAFTLELPRAGRVEMRVYDVRGALVRTLVEGEMGAGVHTVAWDGRDERGRGVASGVYLVFLSGPEGKLARRIARLN